MTTVVNLSGIVAEVVELLKKWRENPESQPSFQKLIYIVDKVVIEGTNITFKPILGQNDGKTRIDRHLIMSL